MTAKQAPEGVGGPTPGPWVVRESLDMTGDIGIIARGDIIAECFAAIRTHDEKSPEVRANARLIAAAPELLEALEEARLQLEYMDERSPSGTTPAVLARITAAIAKAHGGSQ